MQGHKGAGRYGVAFLLLVLPPALPAAHPLITDDTGTQGRGRYQLEVMTEHGDDRVDDVRERVVSTQAVLSYGLLPQTDLVLTLPRRRIHTDDDANSPRSGVSDIGLDLKWRFFERDAMSLVFQPGVTLPTGDEDRGLGSGRAGYGGFLVASYALSPWAFHAQLGYVRNRNVLNQRESILQRSVAVTREVAEGLRLVADIGAATHPSDDRDAAFLIAGLIYAVTSDFDVDVGYKKALSRTEVDRSLLAGVTFRF